MKLFVRMPAPLKPYFRNELSMAEYHMEYGRMNDCWRHLERAHILGQPYPYEHSLTHYRMLKFGIRMKNTREVFGQIPRLFFGGVKSFVGEIPTGNTGGSNVPPLRPMDIPDDLADIIKKTGSRFEPVGN